MSSLNDQLALNSEGTQPSSDNISKQIMRKVLTRTVPQYMEFMQERLVSDCVEKAREISAKFGVGRSISRKPFFLTDEDFGINGAIGNSFALVKPGNPTRPLRIIIAHSDIPCLRIPANPIYVVNDSARSMASPSISLRTEPFGGVRPDDWYGTEVDIVGKMFIGGKVKRIELPGRIRQKSLHVDNPGEMKTYDGLKVDTGYQVPEKLYRQLGITSADDFSRSRLYCFPHSKTAGRLVGHELGGFGHDDRACVWASLMAGLETLASTNNTVMIFGLDNEEIGGGGNSASYRGFFENILEETLKVVYGPTKKFSLPADLNRGILGVMPAIFADVAVGLGPEELEDPRINFDGASRMGWGPFIYSGILTSPKHVDKIMTQIERDLPDKKKLRSKRYQMGGDYSHVDLRYSYHGDAQMSDSFGDVMPCLNIGLPVTGLHHPRTETINVFDLHWMREIYKIYLKN